MVCPRRVFVIELCITSASFVIVAVIYKNSLLFGRGYVIIYP